MRKEVGAGGRFEIFLDSGSNTSGIPKGFLSRGARVAKVPTSHGHSASPYGQSKNGKQKVERATIATRPFDACSQKCFGQ